MAESFGRAEVLVRRFNAAINAADPDGLAALMADDHTFVDSAGEAVVGRAACLEAWREFFAAFPGYRNEFARFAVRGDAVMVTGRSVCSEPALDGPALWTVRIRDGLLTEWHVHDDTPANRSHLGLP